MKNISDFINEQLVNEGGFSKGDLQNWDIIKLSGYDGYWFYLGPEMTDTIEWLCSYDDIKRINYSKNGILLTPNGNHNSKPCDCKKIDGMKRDLTNRDEALNIVKIWRPNFDEATLIGIHDRKDKNGYNLDWQKEVEKILCQYIPISNSPSNVIPIEKAKMKSDLIWSRD